jgi:hypothetical protein
MPRCESCSLPTDVHSDYLRRDSVIAIPHPAGLLCRDCVERLNLPIERDGSRRFVRFRGHEYHLFFGTFLRALRPAVVIARYSGPAMTLDEQGDLLGHMLEETGGPLSAAEISFRGRSRRVLPARAPRAADSTGGFGRR